MTSPACPACGHPATVEPVGEVAMADDEVTVSVQGLAVSRCEDGHVMVRPDGAAERLSDEVGTRLLVAERHGLVRRRDHCGACGAGLVLPARVTDTPVPTDLDGQVVTPIVEAPMARCPDCGLEQLPPDVADRVERLLRACVEDAAGR